MTPIPEQKLRIFEELHREVVHQYHEFREFMVLYYQEDNELRPELLNEVAKHFFGEHFYMMLERLVLHVSKLTDPQGSGSRSNFSLEYVHSELSSLDAYPRDEAGSLIERTGGIREHLAVWRSKLVAHKDRAAAFQEIELGEVQVSRIGEFYELMGEYLELVGNSLGLGPAPIETVSMYGAQDLVGFLKKAIAFDDLYKKSHGELWETFRRSRFYDA